MTTLKKLAVIAACAALTAGTAAMAQAETIDAADMKVGVIYVGDEQEGYSLSHMSGIDGMQEALGLADDQVIEKFNIPEDESCYDAAVDLADQGCQIIFGTSFGHEGYLIQAATEYPDVQFCHATGYQAAMSELDNMHNYFTSIYEARYVSGIVAGLKLAELDAAGELGDDVRDADGNVKIGYVGAYSYAEVISGYTAFFLGLRSEFPNAVMEVKYTGSWADQALEKETAEALIADGCALVAQHADTTGAAAACEAGQTWHVGYNVGMLDVAPNYDLTSSTNNWAPYYTYAVESVMNGEPIDVDWCHGHADGAVLLTDLGQNVAEGTEEAVNAAWEAIDSGELKVFDTATWTVGGETVTSTADMEGFNGLEYISEDGYFMESELGSAPAFTFIIDGITELNQMY
ncbi:MAG: BMP family ABC transporter substrate-binding protein [Lachnospiraceae bacterium]|nr:BMP family ABC transporter substrate-binding protein [Lachnospiraceae bacterium]